ncbi:MAG TPA: SCP2 sterol-binding domain-containing protein [Phycisphaerae bacterium]|nr:SCP2 sterol-binding domain-containing protein [Phycisphaerae bacterium]
MSNCLREFADKFPDCPVVICGPTIVIRSGTITVLEDLQGKPNIEVTADSATWLGFLAKEKNLPWSLLTRRIKLRGNPKWLLAFGRCFPSQAVSLSSSIHS